MRSIRLVLAVLALPAALFAAPSPSDSHECVAVVEIPAGSNVKYETDPATGRIFVDRFLSTAMVYPANYGTIAGTLAGDGDELDVLVLTRVPIHPGASIRVRAIGVLSMIDGGESDEKVLAVPVDAVDATYREIQDIGDVSSAERERIVHFFRTYKDLPAGGKTVEVGEWRGAAEARELVYKAKAARGTAASKAER
ncbi:inorganic diphosphatase [Congregicoccus parvus]|uniref:inorganic diphosphatase n=1 Tax=Congregicoccus parvus TaxID=3081749 RepID=UPI003FA5F690